MDHSLRDQAAAGFKSAIEKNQSRGIFYLANHSLGLQPDQTADDLLEGLSIWRTRLDESWSSEAWMREHHHWKSNIALLLGLPTGDCIVPKDSAGQGVRAVLNSWDKHAPIRVVTTTGEFDSADTILKAYQQAGRAMVSWISPSTQEGSIPLFEPAEIIDAIKSGCDLVCVSHVFFQTGQILSGIKDIADAAHNSGAKLLLDVYHSAGCVPLNLIELDVDFAVGGCYKYLRGGPGAGYLALHPRIAAKESQTLDCGWFASADPFAFERSDTIQRARGAQGWMESTFPAIIPYQARAGLEFNLKSTVPALRADSLAIQQKLRDAFHSEGVAVFHPNCPENFGAFSLLVHEKAPELTSQLRLRGIVADYRGPFIRFSPDVLTPEASIEPIAKAVREAIQSLP